MTVHADLAAEWRDAQDKIAALAAGNIDLQFELEQANARPPASPSGEVMPTGDLPGWRYLLGEDFDTDVPLGGFPGPYAGKVDVYPPTYFDTSRNTARPAAQWGQYDAARVVSVSEGVLRKRLHTEGVRPKVAALVPRLPGVPLNGPWTYQTYGRYSVRARVTNPMPGYKFAWLLWPLSNNSAVDGEIDYPERNFDSLAYVNAFVHHAPSTPALNQHGSGSILCDLTKWHTFTLLWEPGIVRVLLDGLTVWYDTDRIPASPMRWVLQTETAITATPPAPDVQGDVEIDWLAVWAYAP
jgi:hypothetical protein